MVLTIYGFGQPVLKEVCKEIAADYPNLKELVENMWETMYYAEGVGLAAPQIGLGIRLFVIDTVQIENKKDGHTKGIKQVFINARIIEETGTPWEYEEGCLSIPGVRGKVERQPIVRIEYFDEQLKRHEAIFDGINARVIQHEYDHIEGKLFVEKMSPARRQMMKNKLENTRKGRVDVDYKIKFAGR
jgi:peptide deformylase